MSKLTDKREKLSHELQDLISQVWQAHTHTLTHSHPHPLTHSLLHTLTPSGAADAGRVPDSRSRQPLQLLGSSRSGSQLSRSLRLRPRPATLPALLLLPRELAASSGGDGDQPRACLRGPAGTERGRLQSQCVLTSPGRVPVPGSAHRVPRQW